MRPLGLQCDRGNVSLQLSLSVKGVPLEHQSGRFCPSHTALQMPCSCDLPLNKQSCHSSRVSKGVRWVSPSAPVEVAVSSRSNFDLVHTLFTAPVAVHNTHLLCYKMRVSNDISTCQHTLATLCFVSYTRPSSGKLYCAGQFTCEMFDLLYSTKHLLLNAITLKLHNMLQIHQSSSSSHGQRWQLFG